MARNDIQEVLRGYREGHVTLHELLDVLLLEICRQELVVCIAEGDLREVMPTTQNRP